jgi:hypothetical protein
MFGTDFGRNSSERRAVMEAKTASFSSALHEFSASCCTSPGVDTSQVCEWSRTFCNDRIIASVITLKTLLGRLVNVFSVKLLNLFKRTPSSLSCGGLVSLLFDVVDCVANISVCTFSGKDQMLPSADESKRLRKSLPNCRVRYFKDSGHTLLLVWASPLLLLDLSYVMQSSLDALCLENSEV